MYTNIATMTKCMLLQLVQLVASTAALATLTAAASMHPQLELSRPGCNNCELEDGERVSFVCKMSSCTPGSFSIGFYRMSHSKPVSIHANTPILPGGPVVNVTGLESDTDACAKVLTFVASESLNHTVLVCIAVGYSHPICSLPVVLAVRADHQKTKNESNSVDCNCGSNCTDTETSSTLYSSPSLVLMCLSLVIHSLQFLS